jgi:predicted TIM-barrel fold metal-dependent hydrolase
MLAGLRRLGAAARGIAVVDPGVTEIELDRLHQAGVRGVRFQGFRGSPDFRLDTLAPLARRIADRGWHVQLHLAADAIAEQAALLRGLPAPLVIDHFGRVPQPAAFAHPAYRVIRSLLDAGHTWVKLSGAYHDSRDGAPTYSDSGALARAYIDAAPERVVWGSDWPYPSASAGERPFPDTAQLFDLLADWAPDESALTRILVTNPEALYGFDTARTARN